MVIPVMSGASLTSSVVAKPSADAVSLPEVLLAAVASEVLSLSAVLSETDVLSVWLSETSAADAVDVLLSETAEVPDADDVLLPVDAVLPQAVSDIAAARKSAAHFFSFLSFFPVICYSPYLLFILSHTITHLNLFAKTVLHQYNIHTKEAALEFQAEK